MIMFTHTVILAGQGTCGKGEASTAKWAHSRQSQSNKAGQSGFIGSSRIARFAIFVRSTSTILKLATAHDAIQATQEPLDIC